MAASAGSVAETVPPDPPRMTETLKLPLPLDALPKGIRRFCDPKGPAPARVMAAKGLVPVRGLDQITLLCQLTADEAKDVQSAARASIEGLPDNVVLPACDAELHPAVLDCLARLLPSADAQGRLVANPKTADATVERVALTCSEQISERIAVNEARLLMAPTIIEALYKNKNTRMSTADRLVELASRNHIELPGIPCFRDHVEALKGQLIPEASDEPLPTDELFKESLVDEEGDEDAFEHDKTEGTEEIKQQFKPLNMAIAEMTKAEKLRLATIGSKAARAILVRDNNKQIAMSAITSPQTTAQDAAETAKSKEVTEEVLRFIGSKKEWIKNGEVKHNLCFNPKTPVGISLKFLSHLRLDELKKLSRNRNVSGQLRSVAGQWVQRREKR